MPTIFIESLAKGYENVLQRGFEFLKPSVSIASSDRICIKPNLTFPSFQKGVMTTPEALSSLVVYLKNFTDRITICESDSGGYNRFPMDQVFRSMAIDEMARRYGVRVVNLSHESSQPIQVQLGTRNISVPLPSFLLEETDLFISLPVPKVHSNSIVSIAVKNQWGVIQEPALRLRLHPYFKKVIYAVNKALPKTVAMVDGKYGLNRSGPLRGDVVELDWALLADNLFYADYVVAELMGFDWRRVPYLKFIFEKEGICSLGPVAFNRDYREFKKKSFYLKRAWTDYPGLLTFNSRFLAYVGYRSPFARPLHWALYKFREPFY